MDAPLVSVVTPCLDPGERLRRCLASVAAQTYAPVEHVVVDGGSTDGTVELLRESGVSFVSEPDEGQAAALNKGFRLARGDIVGWLNADDTLAPDAVAAVVAALTGSPAAGWAYGDCEIVEPDERRSVRRPRVVTGPESFLDSNPVAQPGTFVTREALRRVGEVDESLHLAMDFDLWLRLADAGFRGVYVPQTLAAFEISDTSKTGSVGWPAFVQEEALALWKSGRRHEAGLKLGAAAAWAAYGEGSTRRSRLAGEVASALAWARSRGMDVRPSLVRAGAASTAAVADRSRARFAHLLRPELWLVSRTRRAVLARAVRRGTRRAEPILGRR
jgi:hypothetical protein